MWVNIKKIFAFFNDMLTNLFRRLGFTQSKGVIILNYKKVTAKQPDVIQNLDAMNVLCMDKTGTRTQDKIVLEQYTDIFGHQDESLLEKTYLNSYYHTGLKNLLDKTVLNYADLNKKINISNKYKKIDEIPFDFSRRRMSVILQKGEEHHLLICKGAIEILSACRYVRTGNSIYRLTTSLLERINQLTTKLNQKGLCIIAVATREFHKTKDTYGIKDETELTLLGYVTFINSTKEGGNIIDFMGSSINDAPALRATHIGVPIDSVVGITKRERKFYYHTEVS